MSGALARHLFRLNVASCHSWQALADRLDPEADAKEPMKPTITKDDSQFSMRRKRHFPQKHQVLALLGDLFAQGQHSARTAGANASFSDPLVDPTPDDTRHQHRPSVLARGNLTH